MLGPLKKSSAIASSKVCFIFLPFFAEIGSLKCKTVFGSHKAYFRKKKKSEKNPTHIKGQLISKCLLGVIVSTKKPTKFLKEFRPWPLKRG